MSQTHPESGTEKTVDEAMKAVRLLVKEEISNHGKWCSATCPTFLPSEYSKCRLVDGYSTEKVQSNYDLCHIFR